MSLVTFIGPRPNLLGIDVTDPAMRLEATQPILTNDAMEKIRHIALFTDGAFKSFELDICYPAAWGADGMEAALASLSAQAEDAIHLGYNILIVSDRKVSADLMPIPALLATAAVHQHLVRKGLRTSTGLVVETGSAREVHHFALLAGYGAEAIHPYLALETLVTLADMGSGPGAARIGEALPEGDQQGALQGDVEDGHLHVPVLLRRADLRSGRPAARIRRQVFHRHAEQRRRRGPVRDCRGGGAAPSARVRRQSVARRRARHRRRVPVPDTRRRARVDAGLHREAPARGALGELRDVSRIRGAHQRSVGADADASRAVRAQVRARADPARGRRAGRRDRQALRDRRDEPRLDLDRGAHDARGGDEPHRRQVEHRRGRRGRAPLSADQEGRDAALAHRQRRGRHRAQGGRFAALEDQAGRLGALRRHRRIPGERRSAADQDGAGCEAGRRRPAAGPQGLANTSRSCASRSPESASFRPPRTTTSIRSRISRS